MIGLTSLTTNGRPLVPPKLNRRRALFVLAKIEEILFWERNTEQERETRFVELGRYLCEVRAGQYWRLDNLGSFDEFLERRFPGSRRKAYYLTLRDSKPTPTNNQPTETNGDCSPIAIPLSSNLGASRCRIAPNCSATRRSSSLAT